MRTSAGLATRRHNEAVGLGAFHRPVGERAPLWQDAQDQNCGGHISRSNSRLNDGQAVQKAWTEAVNNPVYLNHEENRYQYSLMEAN